jgi:polyhydroxyalkanoate synthesis regulator phasin
MSYIQELEELITNVVIPDVNNELDAIFEEITDNKEATEDSKDEIAELRELKEEFQSILDDIQSGDMDEDESKELVNEIKSIQKSEASQKNEFGFVEEE